MPRHHLRAAQGTSAEQVEEVTRMPYFLVSLSVRREELTAHMSNPRPTGDMTYTACPCHT